MLHERKANASQNQPGTAYAPLNSDRMHTFFNAAMDRFLKEQQTARTHPMTEPQTDPRGMRDVEMESVGSHSGYQGEFDPDDLSIDVPRPALVASAGVSSGTQPRAGVAAPRIRVSAISELKEFSGEENDEDRARSWLGKVKSAFVRDQALDGESRGYWKYHDPGKWFKQAKAVGENAYMTEGRTKIKVTLAGTLVYYFDAWVGSLSGQEAILGMDFMVPAGIRLDLADGTLCLPDESLAFEATTDRREDAGSDDVTLGPMVGRPRYVRPTQILTRQANHPKVATTQATDPKGEPKVGPSGAGIKHEEGREVDEVFTEAPGNPEPDQTKMQPEDRDSLQEDDGKELHEADQVCIHEGGDLFAEDVESQMAVLPEVVTTTEEVTIDDLQVGDPEINTPEEIDRLRQIIWKRAHLLIGKGNTLPPAALGATCDIDVGGATPIAQRCRRVAPQFREKLSDLIKGLLSATIITHSTSPWASPIVIIIKKNGVDIRLCIDYRLVNSLTKLMVYPMPLINDLLEDLDKVLWYCSLDMASGFWVVSMTERA
ncbi:Reverse transcriptase [Phytophthora palmivora]|uniref:Reverse transcriptase n=1 Tax=Phytophthora palmivora TaxID=4796 RepID=A0A2P4YR23_9STRA|nr:Reverse transcriptase [Phytophthora palmivora]